MPSFVRLATFRGRYDKEHFGVFLFGSQCSNLAFVLSQCMREPYESYTNISFRQELIVNITKAY